MRSKLGFLAILAGAAWASAQENYTTWSYMRNVAINTTAGGANVSATQANFPVLVRLTASNFDFTQALSTGADVRFTASNGTTRLKHQIERWDAGSQVAEVWVLVPSVTGNNTTTINMYTGKTGAADSSSGSAVFTTANGFQGVFHLGEAVNDTARDATANNHKGVPSKTGANNPQDVAGVIGKAKDFLGDTLNNNGGSYKILTSSGGNTYMESLNFQDDSANTWTISAWVYANQFPNGTATRKAIIAKSKGTNGSQYHLRALDPAIDQILHSVGDPSGDTNRVEFADGPTAVYKSGSVKLTTGSWFHMVAVRNGPQGTPDNLKMVVNAGAAWLSTSSLTQTTRSDFNVYIGSYSNDSGYFGGRIDEVTFSNVARDDNWIKLTYETQKPGASCVSVSAVVLPAPTGLTYSTNPAAYPVNGTITNNNPTVTGTVTTWAISPALPTGLNFNTGNGVISGTPTVAAAATNYIITASNGSGSATATLPITVYSAPSGLAYTTNPATYTVGSAITANTPSVTGPVTGYSVTPALPAGLTLNATTGVVTGTPTAAVGSTGYTVTASNAAGSATVTLTITVNIAPPTGLTYSANPASYVVNAAITNNNPSNTGGAPTGYAVTAGGLPTGLTLNTTTGVISGTPTVVAGAASVTITATNTAGSTAATLSITIVPAVVAPISIAYTPNPAVYGRNIAITSSAPTVTGGSPTSYSISPALPTGLSFSTSTGVISGTPTVATGAANYNITGTNSAGSASVSLSLAVLAPPTAVSYATNPAIYGRSVAIAANNPTVTGGAATSFAVSPTLPAGLTLNTTTGVITGTATAASAGANYTVTASNVAGSVTVVLVLTVLAPPTALTYSTPTASYTTNQVITNNTPTVTGTVQGYAINPALPAGLTLNTINGVISGTPTAVIVATNYTVTASNVAGSTTAVINITTHVTFIRPMARIQDMFFFRLAGAAALAFPLPKSGAEHARFEMLDISGRTVWTRTADLGKGQREMTWNGMVNKEKTIPAGAYIVQMTLLDAAEKTIAVDNKKMTYTP